MPGIFWSSTAASDLENIATWLLQHHTPQHAQSFVDSIDTGVSRLAENALSGRIIPELERQNVTKYREIVVSPWRVFYSPGEDRVVILAVIDGRRNIEDILLRRSLR